VSRPDSWLPLVAVVLAAALAVGAKTVATPAARVYPPGVAIVDPESMSVLLGRRTSAPLVRKPFTDGAPSAEQLGRQICRIFERTPTLDSLMSLSIEHQEFRDILWPEFPQSRPATGLRYEDGWQALHARLLNGNNSALVEFGGRPCEWIGIEVESVATYKNFKLHNGITLVTRGADGRLVRHTWLRSIAERKGRFKIYSVRD
jgi:hypothetical protein